MLILVIENENSLRRLFMTLFEKRGHTVHIAKTFSEARHCLKTMPINLVLLDIPYPNDTQWALLDYMAHHFAHIPVIVTSTLALHLSQAQDYPNVQFVLEKPFRIEKLLSFFHEVETA
jgi:DNA-binding NtrC family response regulator